MNHMPSRHVKLLERPRFPLTEWGRFPPSRGVCRLVLHILSRTVSPVRGGWPPVVSSLFAGLTPIRGGWLPVFFYQISVTWMLFVSCQFWKIFKRMFASCCILRMKCTRTIPALGWTDGIHIIFHGFGRRPPLLQLPNAFRPDVSAFVAEPSHRCRFSSTNELAPCLFFNSNDNQRFSFPTLGANCYVF